MLAMPVCFQYKARVKENSVRKGFRTEFSFTIAHD